MLDRYERDKLSVIESQIAAADPEFAALLRCGRRHRRRAVGRIGLRVMVGLLVVLAGGSLALNLPACSLVLAGLAAAVWLLRDAPLTPSRARVPPAPPLGAEGGTPGFRLAAMRCGHLSHSVGYMSARDTESDLSPEHASRMAVIAVAADIEHWARTASVDGRISLNDLAQVLDLIRQACSLQEALTWVPAPPTSATSAS
jgi:hypothetical protein